MEERPQNRASHPDADSTRLPGLGWWAMIVLVCVGLGIYFCSLQNLLYTHYQPFFDSMSYYNNLHAIMSTAQDDGVGPALAKAFNGSNDTVIAPYIAGALVGPLVKPTRNFGVWLQIAELFVLLSSLFYYFSTIRKLQPGWLHSYWLRSSSRLAFFDMPVGCPTSEWTSAYI